MLTALGCWSSKHRRLVVALWGLLLIAGVMVGSQVFSHVNDSHGGSGTESVRGFNLMDKANRAGPRVIAVIDGAAVTDPATRAAVLQAKQKLQRLPDVLGVITAYDVNDPRLRSTDGRGSLMLISVRRRTTIWPPAPAGREDPQDAEQQRARREGAGRR